MGARTNWFNDQIPTASLADPFEVDVEAVGKPIDLTQPTASLDVRLTELLHREAALDNLGVTCGLKDRRDVVCSVCPISMAGEQNVPLGDLCRVGREQEEVTTRLAVQGQDAAAAQ